MSKNRNAVFVPSIREAKEIFDNISFRKNKYGLSFAEWNNTRIIITGVGKANAAFSSCISLIDSDIESVVLMGICGAYRMSGKKPGDIVCITKDYFADDGLLDSVGTYKLLSEMDFPVSEKGNYSEFKAFAGLHEATANTVSFLSGTDKLAEMYCSKTGAAVENMEGAAFGMVCERLNIKAYQVRAVSNFCGERKKQEWNIKKAINALKNFAAGFSQ